MCEASPGEGDKDGMRVDQQALPSIDSTVLPQDALCDDMLDKDEPIRPITKASKA